MVRVVNRYFAVVLVFFGLNAALAQADKVVPDTEISMGIGETVTVDGERLRITFKAVLEDSRCPLNAVCMWAGNARMELDILDVDGQRKLLMLNTEQPDKVLALMEHTLKLIALQPPRIDGVTLAPNDYRLALMVRRQSFAC